MAGGDRRGFTLVELLVTLAIISFFSFVVMSVSFNVQRTTIQNKLVADLQNDMRYALDQFSRLVRLGSSVQEEGNKWVIYFPAGVYAGGTTEEFGYNNSNKTVWLRAPQHPVSSNIESLQVSTNDDTGEVTLILTSLSEIRGIQRNLPITMTTTVTMRNR